MGYNLYIGEAALETNEEDLYAAYRVDCTSAPGAPLNSSNDRSNVCFPSYCAWGDFARGVGLDDVFYSTAGSRFWKHEGDTYEPLLAEHPGIKRLTPAHLARFEQAREAWMARSEAERAEAIEDDVDWNQRRLNWLVWWTRWALDNCKRPAFYNS